MALLCVERYVFYLLCMPDAVVGTVGTSLQPVQQSIHYGVLSLYDAHFREMGLSPRKRLDI